VAEVRAVVALLPPMPHYPSTSRHSIRSRAWGASLQGCSFKVLPAATSLVHCEEFE